MTSSDLWDADAARRYDDASSPMFSPEILGPTVNFLAELTGDGQALELAIGTGRVAVPLLERGVPVAGIELSEPMVEQLRRKASATEIPVVVGDMATTQVEGVFSLVEPFGGTTQRPAAINDAARQPQSTGRSERGISVRHEDLRVEERFLDSSTPHSEVFLMSPRHAVHVPNEPGQYI